MSWTDAFILGDVYILGFGFGFAESDMWWLLNRKKRAGIGSTVFYELNIPDGSNNAKLDLLRLMNVEVVPMTVENGNWTELYERAINDIEERIKRNAD